MSHSEPETPTPFLLSDQLEELQRTILSELESAAGSEAHPWRYAQLASIGERGPEQRIVVLRDFDRFQRRLFAHTDLRTPKVSQIRQNPRVSWLFWNPSRMLQLILKGTATVHASDDVADRQWASSSISSRRAYLAPAAPGALTPQPSQNLPQEFEQKLPTEEELQPGRQNFAVIAGIVEEMDFLAIRKAGTRRAHFLAHGKAKAWSGIWLEP